MVTSDFQPDPCDATPVAPINAAPHPDELQRGDLSAALLASYRELEHVAVWRYGQAPPALRAVVAASRHDPAEIAPHSLRIGEASLPASGGSVSEHVITKEMR